MEAEKDNPIHTVVLSATGVSFVDSTGLQVLRSMIESWKRRQVRFFFANSFGTALELFTRILGDLLEQEPEDMCDTVRECLERLDSADVREGLAWKAEVSPATGTSRKASKSIPLVRSSHAQSNPALYELDLKAREEEERDVLPAFQAFRHPSFPELARPRSATVS